MDTFTHADVHRLNDLAGQWSVSIFLPTHRTGTATQQDPIRLKNLLREAEKQLRAAGVRKPNALSVLAPSEDPLSDNEFWQHQSDGLAVFAADGYFKCFRVPLPLDELVIVARRFQLKPLFPLLTGDGHFYILALSQNEVRVLEATRNAIDEIDVAELPNNFRDAVGLDDREKQLQFHTRASEHGGSRAAMFHGHGPGDEVTKDLLAKYFRQIDEAVCRLLMGNPAPLVLAGVDYYFSIFRENSRYPRLVAEGVAGNPEALRPGELHSRAWPLVEAIFRRTRDDALTRFRQLAGTGRTSTDISEVLLAACEGRIETLMVPTDRQQWGKFDPQTQEVVLCETADAHNEDLMDRAAVEVFLKGGVVYAMSSGDLPDVGALAAVYRY